MEKKRRFLISHAGEGAGAHGGAPFAVPTLSPSSPPSPPPSPPSPSSPSAPEERASGTSELRVIGGDEINPPMRFPFLAALVSSGSSGSSFERQYCGASRLSPRHFVTAAHCNIRTGDWVETPRHDLTVDVGDETGAEAYRITAVSVYPGYDTQTTEGDVAVVEIAGGDDSAEGATIAAGRSMYLNEADGTALRPVSVAGWGSTLALTPQETGAAYARRGRAVEVLVRSDARCADLLGSRFFKEGLMTCASGDNGEDTCQGDSGGPLFVRLGNGGYAVAAVSSWGFGCGQSSYPGVYASIHLDAHAAFIDSVVRAAGDVSSVALSPAGGAVAAAAEGSTVTVSVRRVEGSDGSLPAASVTLQPLSGTASVGPDDRDADIEPRRLSWARGDASEIKVTFTITADNFAEGEEYFFIHLVSPRGMYVPSGETAFRVVIPANAGDLSVDPYQGDLGPLEPESLRFLMAGKDDDPSESSPTPAAGDEDGTTEEPASTTSIIFSILMILAFFAAIAIVLHFVRRRRRIAALQEHQPHHQHHQHHQHQPHQPHQPPANMPPGQMHQVYPHHVPPPALHPSGHPYPGPMQVTMAPGHQMPAPPPHGNNNYPSPHFQQGYAPYPDPYGGSNPGAGPSSIPPMFPPVQHTTHDGGSGRT